MSALAQYLTSRRRDTEPRAEDIGPRTFDQLSALPEPNRRWLVLLGPRSVDQRQGLLRPIATFDLWDPGPDSPFPGPRVSDHGPLVLAL